MKISLIIFSIIFASWLIAACDQKPKNPVSEYGDALIGSYKKGQQAGETANLDAVKKAIQAYRVANDKYPANLDELKDFISGSIDFSKYDYNPENGTVSLKK